MSRAVDLLLKDTRPIKQIAYECGYTDVSNFYRDFKTVHRCTPREVRLNGHNAA
jgi:AraC-like DNA-binding protein